MSKRAGAVTFKGNPLTLVGNEVSVGDAAPDFTVAGNDLSPIKLSDHKGKAVLLVTVPSLDTPVCDTETRRFNQEVAKLGDGAVVLTVSMDLPFAQSRWCGAAGVENVVTASDYKDRSLGNNWGLLIDELGLLARAVYVIDKDGKVTYGEVVKEVTAEPNYDAAVEAARSAM